MNVVITLPSRLIDKILSGEKTFELRKSIPNFTGLYGQEGFFVIEKGTDIVRCFCSVDDIFSVEPWECSAWCPDLCVSDKFIKKYVSNKSRLYLWHISNVFPIDFLHLRHLGLKRNPQSYSYTNFPCFITD